MLEINFILSISKPIQRLFLMEQLVICRSISWDAWTRQIACHTRVRRDKAWGTPLPVRRCHVQFFLFFIFIIFFFTTHADATQTRANVHWIGPIHAEPSRIGSYRPTIETDRNAQKRPKSSLNQAEISFGGKISHLKDTNWLKVQSFCVFSFSFFFSFFFFLCVCGSRHRCFLRIF